MMLQQRFRLAQPIKQMATAFIVELPGIGQADLARGAIEQLRPQLLLQLAHQPAHMGIGYLQLTGSRGKATKSNHSDKCLYPLPMLHCCSTAIIK